MADRHITYKLQPFLQGGKIADAEDVEVSGTNLVGILTGISDAQTGLRRLDNTGIGATIFRFSGNYSAQASNINEWFGGKQLVRMRCTSNGGFVPATFDLPGTTALNTAFDQLVAAGLPEMITFVIEYTGPASAFLSIRPRVSPSPQITGTTNIPVRSGIGATVEITRTSGTISDYVFSAIGQLGDTTGGSLDTIKLINPTTEIWDASLTGTLPSSNVVKGNAYRVANAPTDGSGRFGETMQNLDWVVWEGETFTSWSAEPHQWFVLPAHDVRRISALETEFLNDVTVTAVSDRNAVIRGENYADEAGEIRMKIYATPGDYSAADLNTTGDVDEYSDPTDQNGHLAIRLTGNLSSVQAALPVLFVYSEDGSGNFTRLLNLEDDFTHQGDFSGESDYLSNNPISYETGSTLRIYVTTRTDRYNINSLDVDEDNLTEDVQRKLNAPHGQTPLPEPLQALNTNAEVFNISHTEFRSNYDHSGVSSSFAFLKNEPDGTDGTPTYPISSSDFVNEITGSVITGTVTTALGDVYIPRLVSGSLDNGVDNVTNGAMTGAGIVDGTFRIDTPDSSNFRLVIGMSFVPQNTAQGHLIHVKQHDSNNEIPLFDVEGGNLDAVRISAGTTSTRSVEHSLYGSNGEYEHEFRGINTSQEELVRVYEARTYTINFRRVANGNPSGTATLNYTVTDANTSQAETTHTIDFGGGYTQDFDISYTASDSTYGGPAHTLHIGVDSINGNSVSDINQLYTRVSYTTTESFTTPSSTTRVSQDEGAIVTNRLHRAIFSFRTLASGPNANYLECVYTLYAYDSNGIPHVYDENNVLFNESAFNYDWSELYIGGGGLVIQNVQGFFLNPDTPLLEYPRHSTLRDWLEHHDNKRDDYVWDTISIPNNDIEAVRFPESVNFTNFLLESEDNTIYRLSVKNDGTLETTEVV